jgi:predicted DNA-binding transcriptional regulator YafY
MSHFKHALIRYRIIDRALRNSARPFPKKEYLRELCEAELFGSNHKEHISDSTIEKDLFAMRNEYDAPIAYSVKHRGYYYTDKKFTLEDAALTEEDLGALKFAMSTLSQFRNVSFMQDFGLAIDRIVARVEGKADNKNRDNFIQFETGFGVSGQEYINFMIQAIEQGKVIYFDYQSFASDATKRRKVAPLLLKEYRNRWYLTCYDLVRDRIATFGLDRLSNPEMSMENVRVPINFEAEHYFKHAVGITVSVDFPQKVVFTASALASKYIDSDPIHHSQKTLEQSETSSTFELHVMLTE